ncbi:MAG: cytochrome c family protein [Sphingomonas sp.]|nr:cytochrome c family protein [Sphingomonas sp.]
MLAALLAIGGGAVAAPGEQFEGVASCAGTTCHARLEGDGAVVRQDELARWQEPASATGAHSRAFSVLSGGRAQQIATTLGLGAATSAPACLGCHATPTQTARGPRFVVADGVGCEACHGPASRWIASHYAVGASHAANVANGLVALDRPIVRANLCLDCHYGSAQPGQFVSHRMMAAGHPRVSFELALFSTLQLHYDEDADYARRKGYSDDLRLWAVGQAVAVKRAASLFSGPRGNEGAFPEFYFFDCHSCHRRIYDQASFDRSWEANGARPIPAGMPPFNDENMILLSAAAKAAAPALAARFDGDVRAFHLGIAGGRATAIAASARLAASADALASALDGVGASGDLAFAILDRIAAPATTPRFTDYQGSVQAVMATDTLLSALIRQRRITVGAAAGIRADINRAYAAVREPNGYRPPAFRSALASAIQSIRALR